MLTVQGQTRALAQIQRSLRADRLASTFIFAGQKGVGKFTLAIELAKTVLCDQPIQRPNGDTIPTLPPDFPLTLPCNTCESCRAVAMRSHPDLHIITKELIRYHDASGKSKGTTLSVQVIRGEITGDPAENKESKIGKRSTRGRGKFFILNDADLMDPYAQNILLKTLEEPPPHSYLILITASPQDLLQTIRSRSQIVEFTRLPDEVIGKALQDAGMLDDDAALMARLAKGSLGQALRWAGDIRLIDEKLAQAAERAEKKAARSGAAKAAEDAPEDDAESDDEPASKSGAKSGPVTLSPGGILTWTRELGGALDQLVAGRAGASDLAGLISRFAAEYSLIQLKHDPLTSADRAKRDGIQLLMSITADWFADRLRHALGTPLPTPLPGITGALDYGIVPDLIAAARTAEFQIDQNANEKILLAATTTRWEQLLHTS